MPYIYIYGGSAKQRVEFLMFLLPPDLLLGCQHTVWCMVYIVSCTVYTVSVLGQEEGYTVKYTPPPEGVNVTEKCANERRSNTKNNLLLNNSVAEKCCILDYISANTESIFLFQRNMEI